MIITNSFVSVIIVFGIIMYWHYYAFSFCNFKNYDYCCSCCFSLISCCNSITSKNSHLHFYLLYLYRCLCHTAIFTHQTLPSPLPPSLRLRTVRRPDGKDFAFIEFSCPNAARVAIESCSGTILTVYRHFSSLYLCVSVNVGLTIRIR